MTTLESIGFTCLLGAGVFSACLVAFGCAVRHHSVFVSPRCTARPPNVIYNAQARTRNNNTGSSNSGSSDTNSPAPRRRRRHAQDRGNAWLGWIPWVLSIPYDTMLRGIPGTGTRDDGMSGSMLKLGLDAVVLLRFHVVGLKLSALATVLLLVFMLPIYSNSVCVGEIWDPSFEIIQGASTTADNSNNNNINDGTIVNPHSCNLTNYERLTLANIPSLAQQTTKAGQTFVHPQESGILAKLYACCFIFLIITAYLLYLLQQEWVQILAMRRVYYFEHDIYGQRKQELAETTKKEMTKKDKEEPHLMERDPWIPHPEQRDTVPTIALYSVLVGGIPRPPSSKQTTTNTTTDGSNSNGENRDTAVHPMSKRESIDWQLSLCGAFFDHCVPNQPGFSSSVAAVSILPAIRDISIAWTKWYTAAAKLRRLRFIRKQIARKSQQQAWRLGVADDEENQGGNNDNMDEDDDDDDNNYHDNSLGDHSLVEQEVLALQFGPEQMAVHSREFAQAASSCCPNGCMEGRVRRAPLSDLKDMERQVEEQVKQAFRELSQARHAVVTEHDKPMHHHNKKEEEESHLAANSGSSTRQEASSTPPIPAPLPISSSPSSPPIERRQGSNHDHSDGKGRVSSSIRQDTIQNAEALVESVAGANRNGMTDWKLVEEMVVERTSSRCGEDRRKGQVQVSDGTFKLPTMTGCARGFVEQTKKWCRSAFMFLFSRTKDVVDLSSESTYAVITFTSRQAAVAARHNLVDGRGLYRWMNLVDLPVAPLADGDSIGFRSCCRPITLTIEDRHKTWRAWVATILLVLIYIFYTVPLTAATALVQPDSLQQVFPELFEWATTHFPNFAYLISGLLQALIWSGFFASCPQLFKFISNFGSNATSFAHAEYKAMQYFWWFMVVTAFSGTMLASMFISGLNSRNLQGDLVTILRTIAATVPTTISASWINWTITQGAMMLPLNYLLNINTFIFYGLRMPCCSRMMRGGGPGGVIPYRVYVDTGVAILCVLALAPASPLVAPACFLYFCWGQPLFRRNTIFVYRPRFDGGGHRWPFLFAMVMSALLLGQVLLCVQMVLKAAVGPAVLAGLPILGTYIFYKSMNRRYRRAFDDAALLQTSLLDGWDTRQPQTFKEREEFRRFLVDAHKAAYVPICIAGNDRETTLTSEPALTIPMVEEAGEGETGKNDIGPSDSSLEESLKQGSQRTSQPGATLRRTVNVLTAIRRKSEPVAPADSPPGVESPSGRPQSTPAATADLGAFSVSKSPLTSTASLLKGDFQQPIHVPVNDKTE